MDTSVDPCIDFYKFACGNYRSSLFPEANTVGEETSEKNYKETKTAFIKMSNDDLPTGVKFAKTYYDSCERKIQQPINPIITWLEENVGKWPISSDAWTESHAKISVWSLIARIRRDFGLNTLISIHSVIDHERSDRRNKRHVLQSSYALRPAAEDNYDSYKDYAISIIKAVNTYVKKQGLFISNPSITDEAIKLVQFEDELHSVETHEHKDRSSSVIDYEMLKTKYDAINWRDFMGELFGNESSVPNRFIIHNDGYMQSLNDLFKKTAPETLYNYAIWSLARNTPDFSEYQLHSDMDCFDKVHADMPIAINWIYWHKVLGNINLEPLENVIETVTTTYLKYFENRSNIDEITRANAIEKINSTVTEIGNPEWRHNRTALEQFYTGLEVPARADEFSIKMVLNRWKWAKIVYILKNSVSRDYETDPKSLIDSNAAHVRDQNRQYVQLGKLQPPFYYGVDAPLALQYGSIGFTIAHEFGHAIDTEGIKYGPTGESGEFWISNAAKMGFDSSQECLMNQYSEPCICSRDNKQYCIDAINMMNDIIADQMGLKIAYESFKERQKMEDLIPLSKFKPFSADQLFFLSFANAWCMDKNAELTRNDLTGFHPPVPFRVNLPLKNSKEFAQAFQCEKGDEMNPEKCTIW